MAEAQVKRHPGLPWTIRLFESIPLAPIWIGLLIAGLWLSLFSIYAYFVGWIDGTRLAGAPFWESFSFWIELLQAMMIGYALTATAYWMRGAVRDLHALRPVLRCSDTEFQEELRELTGFERRPLVIAILIGVVIGLAAALNPGGWLEERPPPGDPLLTWVILKSVFLFSLIAHFVHISIGLTNRLSRIGERSAQVDLLDVAPLVPFARNGLRGALLLMGWIVLTSLSLLAPWSGDVAIGGMCVVLGLAVAALLGPVVGVHRRIHEAKRVELERVRSAIRRESALRVETGGEWQPADGNLSDLIVYKGFIESVNTWLFDLPALLKFSFIVLVGVGSWLGQAFVERLLGAFID
jgi:hypothetical protein